MTIEEILAELAALAPHSPDGYYTLEELAEAQGCTKYTMRLRIQAAHKAGRLETAKVRRENIVGDTQVKPGYRVL